MSLITEELVRKRAEHNEGQIGSLEELAIYQSDIIKIDNIQNWCKELKILFLQNNLISRIENLSKLKKLEYLNLAVNNIECVENLEGCESLQKLDLTLNFIGKLTSVQSLKKNFNLRELYLIGNPCCEYENFWEYVIAVLPQIKLLNGTEVFPSQQILACQNFKNIDRKIQEQEKIYSEKRRLQKQNCTWEKTPSEDFNHEEAIKFWNQSSENSPEVRSAMAEQLRKSRKENTVDLSESCIPKRKVQLFKKDGCPLNVNEAKIPFTLEDDREHFTLTVNVYKHLDTSFLDIDVQPWFVRVVVKGKILQLTLTEEVHPDQSSAQRMTGSGRLIVKMPKFRENKIIKALET